MNRTLDFELGYLYRELSNQISGIATVTDSEPETVRARLAELLRPDGLAIALPKKIGRARMSKKYFVEGSKVKGTKAEYAVKKRDKAELLAKVKRLAKTMTIGQIADAIGKSKSTTYGYLVRQGIKSVGQKSGNAVADWWAKMTPEQRSAEMKRRQRVAAANRANAA